MSLSLSLNVCSYDKDNPQLEAIPVSEESIESEAEEPSLALKFLPAFTKESVGNFSSFIHSLGSDDTPVSNPPRVAIFYNIFLNPNNQTLSYDIVKEQLHRRQQMGTAKLATLYYLTVGAPNFTMPSSCGNNCHHIKHIEEGFEEYTLQALYEYCVARPNDRVVYLHNKGSYTNTEMNHRLRRHLTKAVFSPKCLKTLHPTYNVCAAQFSGYPFAQCVGNMFAANCDYIRHLIPPNDFSTVHTDVIRNMFHNVSLPWHNTTTAHCKHAKVMHRPSWLGLERFVMEHWVGSHPYIRPASVFPRTHGEFTYDFVTDRMDWKAKPKGIIARFARHQIHAPPFFQQPGRLYLYEQLYPNDTIPKDSWIWDFYEK